MSPQEQTPAKPRWAGRRLFSLIYPRRTLAVSSSGGHCQLACPYCEGHYLKQMVSLEKIMAAAPREVDSLLVSGGCDGQGNVLLPTEAQLCLLSARYRLNVHLRRVNEQTASRVAEVATAVSLDIPATDKVARSLYGMSGVAESLRGYDHLKKQGVKVVGHVCLGLYHESLEAHVPLLAELERRRPSYLTLLVFRPTPGTQWSYRHPPDISRVIALLRAVREALPQTCLTLGCLRPGGRYRRQLDVQALAAGVDRLVCPSPEARRYSHQSGAVIEGCRCCSLENWPPIAEEAGEGA